MSPARPRLRPPSGHGVQLCPAGGRPWWFDPGTLCLELLLTSAPHGLARQDTLNRPADLAAWLAASRLALPAGRVVTTPADLADARRLREALQRLALAWAGGEGGEAADIAVLNQTAGTPSLAPRIEPDGRRGWVLPATGGQALSTIARDAVALRTGPLAGRIRTCAAEDCHLIFVDGSGPGRRRWCAIRHCGNLEQVSASRTRRTDREPPT